MPAVVIPAIITAGAPYVLGVTAWAGFGAFLTQVAVYTGLGLLAGALARRPDNPSFTSESRDRMQVVRSAVAERRIVYGQVMVSGPLVYAESTGANNNFLHLVIPLAGHEVEEIGEIFLNDTSLGAIDINNFATGSAWGSTFNTEYAHVQTVPGSPHQITVANPVSSVIEVRFQYINTDLGPGWITLTRTTGSPSGPTSEYEYDLTGNTFTFHSSAAGVYECVIRYIHTDAPLHVRVKKHLGTEDQVADADLVAESAGLWTNNHRLRGVAYIYLRLEFHPDVFPFGIPNVRAVVKGKKVLDPRTGTTAWSDNWALCIRDYLVSNYGLYADAGGTPSLTLDFVTSPDPAVAKVLSIGSVTRAHGSATATRVNEQGLIEEVSANTARIDHDPVTLASRGLLIEGGATNLLLQSNAFTTTWSQIGTPNTTQDTVGPDGAVSAWTLTDDDGAAYEAISQTVTVADDSLSHTVSLYVKKTTGVSNTFGINFSYSGGTGVSTTPRLNTNSGNALGFDVEDAGDYWRVSRTLANNGTGNTNLQVAIYPATGTNVGDDPTALDTVAATGSAVIWGAQLEKQSFASSYIPTTTTTKPRNADTIRITDLSGFFNSLEGTMVTDAEITHGNPSTSQRIAEFNDGTNTNRLIWYYANGPDKWVFQVNDNSVSPQTSVQLDTVFVFGKRKIAAAYKLDDYAVSHNGAAIQTDTTNATVPPITRLELGGGAGGVPLNGHLRSLRYWNSRLSNARIVALAGGSDLNPDTEIDDDSVIAAANISDEQVELDLESPSTYQSRYKANGTVNLGDRPVEILREMVTAAAGTVTFSQGVWRVLAGAYQTPTITIDEDWLRGPVEMQARPSRRELFNMVRGKFSNPAKFWQLTDFPAIGNPAYAAQDDGEIVRDVELPFTTNEIAAQRLAKIHLEKSRQGITVKLPCNLKAFQVSIWDTVKVTIDDLGWSAKDFIVLNWAMAPDGNGVDLTLQEEASSVYDWNSGLATIRDPAPDTVLPSPFAVPAPGTPTISEELYETRDGRGVANKVIVQWTAPEYAYPLQYQVEYRLSPDADTTSGEVVYAVLPVTREERIEILDVGAGLYDFRVTALNLIGVSSQRSTLYNYEVFGLAAKPSAPTGVSLQIAGGTAIINLTKHPELDVLRGGRILVRHTEATEAQSWEESLSIGAQDSWPGDSVLIIVPSKAGSYLLKARDSTGQESDSFSTVTTKQASILAFGSLGTIQEDSTFPGTHSDTTVAGLSIEITQDGSPTGPVKSSGTYTFSTGFDFGSVKRVRITTVLQGIVYNANDLIDERTTPIDSWLDFDGSSGFGSSADAWVEVRESDDTSSPTEFGEWKRVDAGEFEAKLLQFRLQLRSFDSAYNVAIDTLRVRAEEVI